MRHPFFAWANTGTSAELVRIAIRVQIKGLTELRERLAKIRLEEVMARALAEQAERLGQAVKDGLSTPPGSGEHDRPWLRSGALRDSIGVRADGLRAVVGSNHPAAAAQERGTARMAPRPFLAPVAAAMGEEIARAIGAKVAAALRGDPEAPDRPAGAAANAGDIQLAQAWLPLLLDEPPAIIKPPLEDFPSDPTKSPGSGYEWRGQPGSKPGSRQGNWVNPETGEWLRPDMDHPEPIGPHWDYSDPDGNDYRWFPNGDVRLKVVPKA